MVMEMEVGLAVYGSKQTVAEEIQVAPVGVGAEEVPAVVKVVRSLVGVCPAAPDVAVVVVAVVAMGAPVALGAPVEAVASPL